MSVDRKEISTNKAPKPGGPYSQAIVSNGMIFISGQLGFIPEENGKLIEGGIIPEARQTFKNMEIVLNEAGSSVKDLVKVTVLLKDLADFQAMNQVYAEYVSPCLVKPARTTFQAGEMPLNSRIEVDAIGIIRKQ